MKTHVLLTKSLLAFGLGLILSTATRTSAQSGLDLIQVNGRVLVDTPVNPAALQLDLNVQFLPSPNSNGSDPLQEDIRATVFWWADPAAIVFIPAGSLQSVKNGYALRDGANVQVMLVTPPRSRKLNKSVPDRSRSAVIPVHSSPSESPSGATIFPRRLISSDDSL